jgi:enoyl-CoA hydratase
MTEGLRADRKDNIYTITLDRADKGNTATDAMIARLGDLVEAVTPDDHAIVLRGAGVDFCLGREAPPASPGKGPPEALQLRRAHDVVFRAYGALRNAPVPVIAVVQGRALGFGFALAASADITLAAETAIFQVPEFAHSIMPTMVMSALVDRIPLKALMHVVYSAQPFSPSRALAIGAISAVCAESELDTELAAIVRSLSMAPRPAVLAVKEYAHGAQAIDSRKALDYARALHAVVNTSSEMRRGKQD